MTPQEIQSLMEKITRLEIEAGDSKSRLTDLEKLTVKLMIILVVWTLALFAGPDGSALPSLYQKLTAVASKILLAN